MIYYPNSSKIFASLTVFRSDNIYVSAICDIVRFIFTGYKKNISMKEVYKGCTLNILCYYSAYTCRVDIIHPHIILKQDVETYYRENSKSLLIQLSKIFYVIGIFMKHYLLTK